MRSFIKQAKVWTLELERNQRAERSSRGVTHERDLSLRGMETTEREGKFCILEMEGQVSCRGGRRETSNLEKMGS